MTGTVGWVCLCRWNGAVVSLPGWVGPVADTSVHRCTDGGSEAFLMAHYFQGGYQPAAQPEAACLAGRRSLRHCYQDGNALAHGADPDVLQQGPRNHSPAGGGRGIYKPREGRRWRGRGGAGGGVSNRLSLFIGCEALRVLPWPSPPPPEEAPAARLHQSPAREERHFI